MESLFLPIQVLWKNEVRNYGLKHQEIVDLTNAINSSNSEVKAHYPFSDWVHLKRSQVTWKTRFSRNV